MVGCYNQISCTNTALTQRIFVLCVLPPSTHLLQKSVSQNCIFWTVKTTLKALFSTSQVSDSTKPVLHYCFFQMSYSSIFYMLISSSLVWIPAKRGKQDTKSKQAAVPSDASPPLPRECVWALSTCREQQRDRAKGKGGSVEGKIMLHLRVGHNLQDWFILGWNYTNWTSGTTASLTFWNESAAAWLVSCCQIVTG